MSLLTMATAEGTHDLLYAFFFAGGTLSLGLMYRPYNPDGSEVLEKQIKHCVLPVWQALFT